MKMDQINLEEVYGISKTSFWQTLPGYAIIIIVFISLLIFLGFLIKILFFTKKNILPEIWAKKELNLLLKHKISNQEDKELVYLKLSEILRFYIQKKYGINKAGMTDLEFLSEIENIQYDLDLKNFLLQMVLNIQKVKFANYKVSSEVVKKDILNSILFLDSTLIDKK